jgi:tRNA dimethylallyltransferase
MFQRGLVAETEQLLKRGLAQNKTAMQALGYRQVIEHLRGERSLADTIALVKLRTRQFAKRQMTWFRGQMELVWIEIGPNDASTAICDRLMVQAGTM